MITNIIAVPLSGPSSPQLMCPPKRGVSGAIMLCDPYVERENDFAETAQVLMEGG